MANVRKQVEDFYQYATGRLNDGSRASFEELLVEWMDAPCRDEINEAIRRGIEDVDAERVYPAHEVMEDLRKEFGFEQ